MFPTEKPPKYEEWPATVEELEESYARHAWDKLREFIDGIQPGDTLIRFHNERGGGCGNAGYYRLRPDGTKVWLGVSAWMH